MLSRIFKDLIKFEDPLDNINKILDDISNYSLEYIKQRKEKDKLSVNLLFSSILAKMDINDSEDYTMVIEKILDIFDTIYNVKELLQTSLFYLNKSRFESSLLQRLIECLLKNYIEKANTLINAGEEVYEIIYGLLNDNDTFLILLCEFIPNLKGYLIKKELLNKIKIESRISYNIYDKKLTIIKLQNHLNTNMVATELFNLDDIVNKENEENPDLMRTQIEGLQKAEKSKFTLWKKVIWDKYKEKKILGEEGYNFPMNEEFFNTFIELGLVQKQFYEDYKYFCKGGTGPIFGRNEKNTAVWDAFAELKHADFWVEQIGDNPIATNKIKYGRKKSEDGDDYVLYNVFTGKPLNFEKGENENKSVIYNNNDGTINQGDSIIDIENTDAPTLFGSRHKHNPQFGFIMGISSIRI